MIATTNNYKNAINASVRKIGAKVEVYQSGTLAATYTNNDAIKSITIERVGEDSKFFGFGVTHKANIKLRDIEREINLSTSNYFKIYIGVKLPDETIKYIPFTKLFITEVNRDEKTNELSITAYDALDKAKLLTVNDLALETSYTIKNVIDATATKLEASGVVITNEANSLLEVELPSINGDVWTSNGITFTRNADGTLTLNGTNDGVNNSAFFFYNENAGGEPLTLEVGETYDVSYFENDSIMFIFFTGTYYRTKDGQTFEATEEEHEFKQVYIQVPKGDTTVFDNYVIRPTLRKHVPVFNLEYPEGANFEGTETLQEVLKAAAEATQTIYFMNGSDELVFKRLDKDGEAVKTISKANYIDLDSKTNRRLATICSVTELGDNVSASITENGTTQYLRDNPFLELREDIAALLDGAIDAIGGMTINQFECNWRGDAAVEIGDKLSLITKDGGEAISYLLNDKISFNGSLSQNTLWEYTESEAVEASPTTLGDILKQTYARVDKANKQVEIMTSEVEGYNSAISALQINTESINASVQNIEASTNSALESVSADIEAITNTVETKMTAEEVSIAIKSELDNGVSKVETATGFKFDETGLNISKTGSEMATNINEDGMIIKRDDEEVLIANNEGVNAYNLHAKTYLIIGETSRFEDYTKDGEKRTGCFWTGGTE